MGGIIPQISRTDKRKLEKRCHNPKDGAVRTRYLIILNLLEGRSPTDTVEAFQVNRSTVCRVAAQFCE